MIAGNLDKTSQAQLALLVRANQSRIDEIQLKLETGEKITKQDIEFLLWRARP